MRFLHGPLRSFKAKTGQRRWRKRVKRRPDFGSKILYEEGGTGAQTSQPMCLKRDCGEENYGKIFRVARS
jgi:hypothetical protein